MGISSHPPREFSLTSAGTKSPGQVKSLFTGIYCKSVFERNAYQKAKAAFQSAEQDARDCDAKLLRRSG
jgi:hypothetical protein